MTYRHRGLMSLPTVCWRRVTDYGYLVCYKICGEEMWKRSIRTIRTRQPASCSPRRVRCKCCSSLRQELMLNSFSLTAPVEGWAMRPFAMLQHVRWSICCYIDLIILTCFSTAGSREVSRSSLHTRGEDQCYEQWLSRCPSSRYTALPVVERGSSWYCRSLHQLQRWGRV